MQQHKEFVAELVSERGMSVDEVWKAAEARLDWPIAKGLNTAHEACDRWAGDRARLAMTLVHPDGRRERWTYAELSRASNQLATAWIAAGVRRGDRIAGVMGQQAEAFIAALAAWRAGFVYMPLFGGFGAGGLAQRIEGGDPALVVVDHHYRMAVAGAQQLMESVVPVYTVTGPRGAGLMHGDYSFWNELERHGAETEMVVTAPEDPATLIYTSGTTGAPKGCIQKHCLPLTIQPFLRHTFALEPGDLLFTGANPGWSYGLYTTGIGPMSLGHSRVAYTGDFDPRTWLKIFTDEQITYVAAAPSAMRRLVTAARRFGISDSVRGATSSGEPLDAPLASAWLELTGSNIQNSYGASESAMILTDLAYAEEAVVPGSLGAVVPGFAVELLDENGTVSPDQGDLALVDPKWQSASGYRNLDERWAERWSGDRFRSGDVFHRDGDGRLWFVGRSDDLIVTSGYNVGPSEVEGVILANDGVSEVAVVGAPDAERGTVIRAVVVPTGTVAEDVLVEQIRSAVKDKLGRHAYPKIIDFVAELPKTETGKIRRNVLRERPS